MQDLLNVLVKDADLRAVFIDNAGLALVWAGSVDALLNAPIRLNEMIAEADTPLALAADTITHGGEPCIAALARVGEESDRQYLAILHKAAGETDQLIDTRTLLFAELDEGDRHSTDLIESGDLSLEDGADVFAKNFGLTEASTPNANVTDLTKHLHNNSDVLPFLTEASSDLPFAGETLPSKSNVTQLNDGASTISPLKAELATGASIPSIPDPSNVISLAFGSDKSGNDKPEANWAVDNVTNISTGTVSESDPIFWHQYIVPLRWRRGATSFRLGK